MKYCSIVGVASKSLVGVLVLVGLLPLTRPDPAWMVRLFGVDIEMFDIIIVLTGSRLNS